MSVCNFTQPILANQCIGDSLITINANFSALDSGLCDTPRVTPGLGTTVHQATDEQQRNSVTISTKNSFVYNTTFESTAATTSNDITLIDGTSIKATQFPYITNPSNPKPLATFSTVCLTDRAPKVTLYWMASGVDNTTVYALNSAVSPTDKGPIWFNGSVNALEVDGNDLYVGGSFDAVGGTIARKFCKINLLGGTTDPLLSSVGSFVSAPFAVGGDLGSDGSVDTIAVSTGFIAVGGSFFGGFKGRGLAIQQRFTGTNFPFYINGEVRTLKFVGNSLYVGGKFDYINYGPNSASAISGQRIITNSLFKIDLATLVTNPIASISNVSNLLHTVAEVNSIASQGTKIYIGGQFQIKSGSTITQQNLCAIDSSTDAVVPAWQPLINGPVYTLDINDTTLDGGGVYLYVGGEFDKAHTSSQFYAAPRYNGSETNYHNAVSYKISPTTLTIQSYWKPMFNDSVSKFVFHDLDTDSAVYCYGRFTEVNGQPQNYLVAVKKTSFNSDTSTGTTVLWAPSIQNGPRHLNNGLVKYRNSVIVGGTFAKVGSTLRHNLAMISDIDGGVSVLPLSSVSWDFGCQVASVGMDYNLDLTNSITISSFPLPYGRISATSFPINTEAFVGNSEGQLARFFVRRPGTTANDRLAQTTNVIGWKVDFNE